MNNYEQAKQQLRLKRNAALDALVPVYIGDGLDYQNGVYYFRATIGDNRPEWVAYASDRAQQVYKLYSDYINAKAKINDDYDDAKEALRQQWERTQRVVCQVARMGVTA